MAGSPPASSTTSGASTPYLRTSRLGAATRESVAEGAAPTDVCEAIVAAGATITHHHGVGADHAPYLPAEVGDVGIQALRALKDALDPAGILNPGKLVG
jgi:alkyldihydroxyacetonephosphate synthase